MLACLWSFPFSFFFLVVKFSSDWWLKKRVTSKSSANLEGYHHHSMHNIRQMEYWAAGKGRNTLPNMLSPSLKEFTSRDSRENTVDDRTSYEAGKSSLVFLSIHYIHTHLQAYTQSFCTSSLLLGKSVLVLCFWVQVRLAWVTTLQNTSWSKAIIACQKLTYYFNFKRPPRLRAHTWRSARRHQQSRVPRPTGRRKL